ncbi:hypothetical protein BH11ACT8_BH11ACT8_16350 [soil metagenome]
MVDSSSPSTSIDDFVEVLREMRVDAGSPSYAEIAGRIARSRLSAGVAPEAARIARTTVYDVFRTGRRRLDTGLVREVLGALELDEDRVEHWAAVARRAVVSAPEEPAHPVDVPLSAPAPPHAEPPPVEPPLVDAPVDAPVGAPVGAPASVRPPAPRPTPVPPAAMTWSRWRPVVLLLAGCVATNLIGRELVLLLGLSLHLDMVGTAIGAILLGPWWGALVGLLTNLVGAGLSGPSSLPFALVNIAGALVWGYGVRRFGMGRTIPRFFALNIVCATVCSCVAAPIVLVLYGGEVGHQTDGVGPHLLALVHLVVVSVFLSNLLISLVDKTISGFVALAVVEARRSERVPLALDRLASDVAPRQASATP